MSGLPGGAAGDKTPNWVVSSWPPQTEAILKWQWEAVLLPYSAKLARLAKESGVERALECTENVPSLLKAAASHRPDGRRQPRPEPFVLDKG